MRLLFFVALAVFGLIAARRWIQKIDSGDKRRDRERDSRRPPVRVEVRDHSVDVRDHSMEKVICATCNVEYAPAQTAWQCPTCKK